MRNLSLFILLCFAHIGFAQLKVNNLGNVGMGAEPDSKSKLLLYNNLSATDTVFGLHSIMNNTNGSLGKPLYGAYFKNVHSGGSSGGGSTFGIYSENTNTTYGGSVYSFYVKNRTGGYAGNIYGSYIDNTMRATCGDVVGSYIKNTKAFSSSTCGDLYGVHIVNVDSSVSSSVYGIRINNTKIISAGASSYGIYSSVSGGATNKRYAGYFTGGKVVIDGNVGIGKEPTAGVLDVAGSIAINGSVVITSDERLKTEIKPLSDKKNKIYLLEGKSYVKTLMPTNLEPDLHADSLTKSSKKEIAEIAEPEEFKEYGYLAQELEKVFPDLVSQDSAGYYAVNYIGLIPLIIEALKDQRSEIEELQEQIKQLVKLMNIKSIDEKVFEANRIESIPLLLQNTPNPFNQKTEIGYYIPETVNSADIYIYDINGFQQRNISISERGNGAIILQASALQAGIYFYTLICDGKPVDTKQMILTK